METRKFFRANELTSELANELASTSSTSLKQQSPVLLLLNTAVGHQKRRKQVENASGTPDAGERSKMTHRKVWGSLETRQDDMPRDISSHLGGLTWNTADYATKLMAN